MQGNYRETKAFSLQDAYEAYAIETRARGEQPISYQKAMKNFYKAGALKKVGTERFVEVSATQTELLVAHKCQLDEAIADLKQTTPRREVIVAGQDKMPDELARISKPTMLKWLFDAVEKAQMFLWRHQQYQEATNIDTQGQCWLEPEPVVWAWEPNIDIGDSELLPQTMRGGDWGKSMEVFQFISGGVGILLFRAQFLEDWARDYVPTGRRVLLLEMMRADIGDYNIHPVLEMGYNAPMAAIKQIRCMNAYGQQTTWRNNAQRRRAKKAERKRNHTD